MNPITLGIFTLAGSLIGALSGIAIAYINRKFDDRRLLRELAVKTAMEYWGKVNDDARLRNEKTGVPVVILPPDPYIIHMLLIAETISSGKRLDAGNVEAELRRIRTISKAAKQAGKPDKE